MLKSILKIRVGTNKILSMKIFKIFIPKKKYDLIISNPPFFQKPTT